LNLTIDLIKPILEEGGLICGDDFDLVYSPERVLPGKILEELVSNDRVVGGVTKIATERAKQIYARFVKGEIHSTDSTTAEMVKLMENTYRDVNIALANEFSRIAHEQRINVWEAIELANHHPRVNILSPGPGVGGHCISVDPWFLVEVSPTVANLIRQARIVNDEQPAYLIKLIKEHLPFLEHKKVAALGLSYKPDIDDLRESPAIEFAKLLAKEGAEVYAYEPFVPGYEVGDGVRTCFNLRDALHGAELIVILVAHQQFKEMDYAELLELSDENAIILDAVNVFQSRGDTDSSRLIKMGWGL
jgi:UDP-N-acetyl-D-mannosaminuronic acid dehydrogenase